MILNNKLQKLGTILSGLVMAIFLSLTSFRNYRLYAQVSSPIPPTQADVCSIVRTMPSAEETDELLALLGTSRSEVTSDLIAMKRNMEHYNAEGYGWQNAIDGSSALEPRPGYWLIAALRMACEPQAPAKVTGTVTYRHRITLLADAKLVVTLEDFSRADALSTVIASKINHYQQLEAEKLYFNS